MSECGRAQQLSAYHDGELPVAAGKELEEHLRHCPHCVNELRRLRDFSAMLAGRAEPDIPPSLMRRLHQTADAAAQISIWRMGRVVAAVAAAILIVCAVFLGRSPTFQAETAGISRWELAALRPDDVAAEDSSDVQLAMWIIDNPGE